MFFHQQESSPWWMEIALRECQVLFQVTPGCGVEGIVGRAKQAVGRVQEEEDTIVIAWRMDV